jgi:hypothetical protein
MHTIDTFLRQQLIHAMLRTENDAADASRARNVLVWAGEHRSSIASTFSTDEKSLFDIIWTHWVKFRDAPGRETLGDIAKTKDKSDGMMSWLEVFDDQIKGVKASDHISVATHYEACLENQASFLLYEYLKQASSILNSSVPVSTKPDSPLLHGPKDARLFLVEKLGSGVFTKDRGTEGGSMLETADSLTKLYADNEKMAADQSLVIRTGIEQIDGVVQGMRRKSFNLILGAAGQRKSAMARTIAYNTAARGQRVLFIPLEMNCEEELSIFAIMHGRDENYFEGTELITIDRFDNGKLTPDEVTFVDEELIPGLKHNLGDNLIIKRPEDTTWPGLRNFIETENFSAPLDLIVIDYFANMNTTKAKDETAYINQAAYEAKQFVLHDLDNGRGGVALLSPAHGNRKGVEHARQNDGNWEREGTIAVLINSASLSTSTSTVTSTALSCRTGITTLHAPPSRLSYETTRQPASGISSWCGGDWCLTTPKTSPAPKASPRSTPGRRPCLLRRRGADPFTTTVASYPPTVLTNGRNSIRRRGSPTPSGSPAAEPSAFAGLWDA